MQISHKQHQMYSGWDLYADLLLFLLNDIKIELHADLPLSAIVKSKTVEWWKQCGRTAYAGELPFSHISIRKCVNGGAGQMQFTCTCSSPALHLPFTLFCLQKQFKRDICMQFNIFVFLWKKQEICMQISPANIWWCWSSFFLFGQ